jgi:hypothetical protein
VSRSATYNRQLGQVDYPRTPATVEQAAAGLVHAARNPRYPHAEAARIVTGLFPVETEYSRALLAAVEAHRPTLKRAAWMQLVQGDAPDCGYVCTGGRDIRWGNDYYRCDCAR